MKVGMDEEVAYQMRKTEEHRPLAIKWVMIIAMGVFLGNATSFGLERAVLYWELKQLAQAATAEMQKISRNLAESKKEHELRSAHQQKIMAEQQKQRQIKQSNKQAAYRQAKETCDFWTQHLKTESTAQNRMYREQACNMANKFR